MSESDKLFKKLIEQMEVFNFIKENKFFFVSSFLNNPDSWTSKELGKKLENLLRLTILDGDISWYKDALISGDDKKLRKFIDQQPDFCLAIKFILKREAEYGFINFIKKWNKQHALEIQLYDNKLRWLEPAFDSLNRIEKSLKDPSFNTQEIFIITGLLTELKEELALFLLNKDNSKPTLISGSIANIIEKFNAPGYQCMPLEKDLNGLPEVILLGPLTPIYTCCMEMEEELNSLNSYGIKEDCNIIKAKLNDIKAALNDAKNQDLNKIDIQKINDLKFKIIKNAAEITPIVHYIDIKTSILTILAKLLDYITLGLAAYAFPAAEIKKETADVSQKNLDFESNISSLVNNLGLFHHHVDEQIEEVPTEKKVSKQK